MDLAIEEAQQAGNGGRNANASAWVPKKAEMQWIIDRLRDDDGEEVADDQAGPAGRILI